MTAAASGNESSRPDRLAVATVVLVVASMALVIAPALGSDRMPPDAVAVGMAVLAFVVAAIAALAPRSLEALRGPAARAFVAFTVLPVLAYASIAVIADDGRVNDYHFSDRSQFITLTSVHCMCVLAWLAASWSGESRRRERGALGLWALVAIVPAAATATMWLCGEFVGRVTGAEVTLLAAYAIAQPLVVLVAALRSPVGTVARALAPVSATLIGLALNLVLAYLVVAQTASRD